MSLNELVFLKNEQPVTSSLQVAENFDKDHKHILESIENLTVENSAVKNMFREGTYKNSRGRLYRMFYMTKDGFTLLAMGFTGKKATRFKIQYINAFNKMEEQIKTGGFHVPSTMSEALRLAANQQDQIEQMKPKVLFANAVETSDTSILVGELAKLISQNGVNIGAGRLFEWLRSNGYLIAGNRSDRNMPTQRSMNLKIFEIKERTYSNPDGSVRVTKTPKVTGKGQTYFVNKFLKEI
ncbi:phage-related antirepressor [Companilactobacillus bobalius DSM 19674]|uniref:Phage-related antirepressor n=1 Tax=Companilactobacillus bobalius DSM 19674 TaxID=1423788 RepID=A0A0R1KJA3_9LACO|nr:phage-related antirepressor [Companilactobacillus bobalius DSM 19674]